LDIFELQKLVSKVQTRCVEFLNLICITAFKQKQFFEVSGSGKKPDAKLKLRLEEAVLKMLQND